ncbi:unnamed protein product [Polarella glacialis]|uniref:Uncharacterized protein n=1 Tax=Polarella glacialis TaxID=89957 RepID=A0A813DLH9_POLGL|nr:unnamed protein product [Polarella glacialis]
MEEMTNTKQQAAYYTRERAVEAAEATQTLRDMLAKTGKRVQNPTLDVTFSKLVQNAGVLIAKVRDINGPIGPLVRVQSLENEGETKNWQRGTASQWWAERGGDKHKFVLKLNLPAGGEVRRARKISLQLRESTRLLTIKANKNTLNDFAAHLVQMFGPIDQVNLSSGCAPVQDLSTFWAADPKTKKAVS